MIEKNTCLYFCRCFFANNLFFFPLCFSDRAHGKEFSRQFEDACNKLEDYVVSLQKEIDHRTAMITMLEQSELFYEDQYREAKIVANVSKDLFCSLIGFSDY